MRTCSKFEQQKTFPKNYKRMRVSLWHVCKITKNIVACNFLHSSNSQDNSNLIMPKTSLSTKLQGCFQTETNSTDDLGAQTRFEQEKKLEKHLFLFYNKMRKY